jgi:hypothetical protein
MGDNSIINCLPTYAWSVHLCIKHFRQSILDTKVTFKQWIMNCIPIFIYFFYQAQLHFIRWHFLGLKNITSKQTDIFSIKFNSIQNFYSFVTNKWDRNKKMEECYHRTWMPPLSPKVNRGHNSRTVMKSEINCIFPCV